MVLRNCTNDGSLHFMGAVHATNRACERNINKGLIMGAWGVLPFENDNASDWVWTLEEADDLSVLTDTLEAVASEEEIFEDAEEAIAAAEVVAALLGRPLSELPPEVSAFVKQQGKKKVPDQLVELARNVVQRIGEDSDLKERWDETDDGEQWKGTLNDLLKRLG